MAEANDPTRMEKAKKLLGDLMAKLKLAKKERFVFLLVGRTGVGKSSTVNSLMGQDVARVGDWEPTTVSVETYESEAMGVRFQIIDTPGLCDELEEVGNDERYLDLIRDKIKAFDCMWFVTKLNETRVTGDEKRGIQLISDAFGEKVWQHAIIVFTFAGAEPARYAEALAKRTELIRKQIAKDTSDAIAQSVPSVAVDNLNLTTPDGQEWMGELYTKVFTRMSDKGLTAFYLATAERIVLDTKRSARKTKPKTAVDEGGASPGRIRLNERQTIEIKKRIDASIIGGLAVAGASIGLIFGPAGAAVGGAAGAAIGLIAWMWE
jgi:predicted GTPase